MYKEEPTPFITGVISLICQLNSFHKEKCVLFWIIELFFILLQENNLLIRIHMERSEILKRVEEIFREELGQSNLIITDDTTAEDVEGWDSLSHVQLVAVMEDVFGIEFSSREILSWDNIGDLIDSIQKKV